MTPTGKGPSSGLLSDLELAQQELLNGSHRAVVAGGGRILARAGGKGLAPLLAVLLEVEGMTIEMALADRIVGLAAAFFAQDAPVRCVYAPVISERAEAYLREQGVHVRAGTRVPLITNREGTGMCPLEKIAVESEDREQAKGRIRDFLNRHLRQQKGR